MRCWRILLIGLLLGASTAAWAAKKTKDKSIPSKETTLDRFVREADAHAKEAASEVSPGSLWFSGARFSDLGQDIRRELHILLAQERAEAEHVRAELLC